ncbi:serine/threonine protein kinase [Fusarium austroafricanum]|uniref:Serine/threonine protein kinase n=1 Tax=Fusarium austroafricanum TaxID=2364996 RepID=A0A8H4KQL4_9HYPO|nr:serine/threonine protein kinase [Fusarium austroafricanum]
MLFSSRFTFALGAFLSFTVRVAAFPGFIESWEIFKRWKTMTDSIAEADVPAMTDLTVGDWDNSEKRLTWMCYTLNSQGNLIDTPDGGTVTIDKAELSYPDPDDPSNTKKEIVVSKRSGTTADGKSVMYGAKLQKGLDHPNILPIHHYLEGRPTTGRRAYGFAIMPLVEEGSVAANLDKYTDQGAVNSAFQQMLSAVSAVSAAGMIHHDLKPENFLKDGDTIKLMDFDQCRQVDTTLQMDVGTPSYQSPEILIGRDHTTKADTFSMAMAFLVMSVTDLRDENTRFQLWKDLIEPSPGRYENIAASDVEKILRERNYGVFNGNDGLLKVIAKAMCSEGERYTPADFETAFSGAT